MHLRLQSLRALKFTLYFPWRCDSLTEPGKTANTIILLLRIIILVLITSIIIKFRLTMYQLSILSEWRELSNYHSMHY